MSDTAAFAPHGDTVRAPGRMPRASHSANFRTPLVHRAPRNVSAKQPDLSAIAELSSRVEVRQGGFIEILLSAARPFDDGFAPLRPLWTQEATHRAIGMMRLFRRLPYAERSGRIVHPDHRQGIARHLAKTLATLETTNATGAMSCSTPLRETARDLVALFGQTAGQVSIATDIVPLSLSAYRQRALVLLGYELVVNALLHAFHGRSVGQLSLRLLRPERGCASLQFCDDGTGFVSGHPRPATSIAGALADLLEGEIRYYSTHDWSTVAEIEFPVP